MKKGMENMGKTGKEERTAHNAKKRMELIGDQPSAKYAEGSCGRLSQLRYLLHRPHVQGKMPKAAHKANGGGRINYPRARLGIRH